MKKPISQVHITPPSCEHGEGYIIANRAGLRRLLVTIERALACGVSRTVVYAGDGEGYDLFVALSEEGLSSDSPPYLEGPRKEGRLPYERVRKELVRRGLHTPVLVDDAETE